MTRSTLKKLSFILTAVVLSGTLYLSTTYATLAPLTPPPSGGYDAGSNSILDPGCGPTDTDCFVKTITADNGLTATGSNVQLGGTLLQNTLIDQDGNDFDITNGNFSFESGNNNLLAVPGIFSTYQDSTTTAIMGIGEFGGPSEKASFIAHSYDDGAGTTSFAQFGIGALAGATYSSSIGWATSYTSPTESYDSEMVNLHAATFFKNRNQNSGSFSAVTIHADSGIQFNFNDDGIGPDEFYLFPLVDGTANQVLTTDGAGQISWVDGSWKLTGNAGTTPGTNFIGTTDAQDFVIKVNNNEMGRFYKSTGTSAGSIALGGGTAPSTNMFVYGSAAGTGATNATTSNFIGFEAGNGATNSSGSNFIGYRAGKSAAGASSANFIGVNSGFGASNADFSNFIGVGVGVTATDAQYSNFIGYSPGQGATFATYSNFFGYATGQNATNASNSNFFGQNAGFGGTNSDNSNFIGQDAGRNAANSPSSNFIGTFAGSNATQAAHSNFIGDAAGNAADLASYSNFIGSAAGSAATTARNSIFIGKSAGFNDTVDNTTNVNDYSILIGNSTSTGGNENSIALGSFATNTASNQFMIGSATRPIDEIVMVSTGGTTCATDINGTACSSDQRLKTNITDLSTTTLDTLLNVKTVTFNWSNNTDTANHIGFIAQDIQQYFPELVSTGSTGYLSVNYAGMTPVIVEAIREMNLKITDINNTAVTNTWRDALIGWFGNVENGIHDIFVKRAHVEELCIGTSGNETCLSKDQVDEILGATNTTVPTPVVDIPPSDTPPPTEESSVEPTPPVEPPTVDTPPETVI